MKLISMTDFVLEKRKIGKGTTATVLNLVFRYADFLKQPLELWMFVACDEEGNILEEPDSIGVGNDFYLERSDNQYQQAKERFLFEGFEVQEHEIGSFSIVDSNKLFHPMWKFESEQNWRKARGITNIENIIGYDLTLTHIAIKQIGL